MAEEIKYENEVTALTPLQKLIKSNDLRNGRCKDCGTPCILYGSVCGWCAVAQVVEVPQVLEVKN